MLGKKLPAPLPPPPAPAPALAALPPASPAVVFDLIRAPCALAAAVALLELSVELSCVQNAVSVCDKSGFAPNFLMKRGLSGAALCMLQRSAEVHNRLLPLVAMPSSSSPPLEDHHLHSASICAADALGELEP